MDRTAAFPQINRKKKARLRGNGSAFANKMIYLFLGLLSFIMLFPFYNVLITSFATPKAISEQAIYILPVSFDLTSYKMVFTETVLGNAFLVSVFITVFGTFVNMVLTVSAGYSLSKNELPGRKFFIGIILFSMIFNGGLVPYFLNIKRLGLINSYFVMIFPVAVDTFLLLIMMNYFRSIPKSLEESARLDGANDISILVKVILPISLPTIAAISLFYAVARWNEWWLPMLFVNDPNKQTMPLILRNMLMEIDTMLRNSQASTAASNTRQVYPEGIKMSAVVLTSLPIIAVYPFIQKHFNAGIMVGSIKG